MSKNQKPINTDLPTYNEKNFDATDNELGVNYGDGRYFNKETGGVITGELKLDSTIGVAHLELNKDNGDFKIKDSQQGIFFKRYRIRDDYIASNELRLGINSQFVVDSQNIKLSSGSNGVIKIGKKFNMDIKNGKMAINSLTIPSTNPQIPLNDIEYNKPPIFYVKGNMSINGTLSCYSIDCPFNPFVTGSIVLYPSIYYPPGGWLPCDGRGYAKSDYLPLWNVIKYKFGSLIISGRESFRVPNFTDRCPMGAVSDIGTLAGDNYITLTQDNLPSHKHSYDIYKAEGYFQRAINYSISGYYIWGSEYHYYEEFFEKDAVPAPSSVQTRPLPESVANGRPYAFLSDRLLFHYGGNDTYSISYNYIFIGDKGITGEIGNTNDVLIKNPYLKYCYYIKT